MAKAVGADAVKFQMFTHDALYGSGETGSPLSYELPREWLVPLAACAKEQQIELMVTAFSPELVAVVDPYVSVHKVASSDAAWPQMLEAVAKTGKPILISFGAKSRQERDRSLDYFCGATRIMRDSIVAMACVASYPADYMDIPDYDHSMDFQGFSDHTLGYTASVLASRSPCCVAIEKHFTAFPDLDTPDRPHSLTPAQFTRMVKLIRGEPVESEEGAMYARHNRRLVATQDIAPGQILRYGIEFGSYRSLVDDARGASPFDWEKVNGRMAKGEIKRGAAIALEDVE